MIICDRHRFAFIHVPKCAGTSVRRSLKPFDDRDHFYSGYVAVHPQLGPTDYGHIPLHILRDHFPSDFDVIRQYWSFALTRNPFERFASSLAQRLSMYGERPLIELSDREIMREIGTVMEYLRGTAPHQVLAHDFIHFQPQVDYLFLDGEQVVQSVYGIHQLGRLLEDVARHVGANSGAPHGQGTPVENRAVTYRSDTVRNFVDALRPALGRIAAALPERVKERMRALVYVPPDKRSGKAFRADFVREFIEDFYRDDIVLWQSLSHRK